MISRKFDQNNFVSLLLLAIGGAGIYIANNISFWDEGATERGGDLLGHVERDIGLVRQKKSGSFMWQDLDFRVREIKDGDSIYTGMDGQAEIALNNGSKMHVAPGSLVVIYQTKGFDPILSLERGHVKLTEKKTTDLQVLYRGQKVKLSAATDTASFDIDGDEVESDGKIHVSVTAGKLNLSQEEQAVAIDMGQRADLGARNRQIVVIDPNATPVPTHKNLEVPRLQAPADGTRFTVTHANPKRLVKFFWNRLNESATDEFFLEEANHEKKILQFNEPKAEQNLGPNHYSWKVRQIEKDGTFSEWSMPSSFDVVMMTSHQTTLFPVSANTGLDNSEQLYRISVKLKWTPVPDVESYEVEIFRGNQKVFEKQNLKKTELSYDIKSIEDAELRYRVTAHFKDKTNQISGFSPIHVDYVAPIPNPTSEKDLLNSSKGITLTWQSTVLTEKYTVQISTDDHFSKIVNEAEVENNFYRFHNPKGKRKYYWRVRSQSKKFKSLWSEVSSFSVRG